MKFIMDEKRITILHFNDVYNIEPQVTQEPQGGAARMSQYVKSVKDLNPLVLFSGDAFNPSLSKDYCLSPVACIIYLVRGCCCCGVGGGGEK